MVHIRCVSSVLTRRVSELARSLLIKNKNKKTNGMENVMHTGPISVSAFNKSDSSQPRGILVMKRVSFGSAIVALTYKIALGKAFPEGRMKE